MLFTDLTWKAMGTCVFGCHGYVSPKYEPWRHQTCCTWYSDAVMTNGWPTAEVWWPDVMYLTVSYTELRNIGGNNWL